MDKKSFGSKGETIAVEFLERQGYTIIKRNLRIGKSEIDILAMDEEVLAVVEVKARGDSYVDATMAVGRSKQSNLARAARELEEQYPDRDIRFDVVTVVKHGEEYKIELFKDAFRLYNLY